MNINFTDKTFSKHSLISVHIVYIYHEDTMAEPSICQETVMNFTKGIYKPEASETLVCDKVGMTTKWLFAL